MIKSEEIAYFRTNITDKYVIEVETSLEAEERTRTRAALLAKKNEKYRFNPNYKRCCKCGEYKLLTEFYRNPLKKQGVWDYCKHCNKLMRVYKVN